jgi:AcrR family transcriptional regulator
MSAVAPARGGRHRNQACDEIILAATLEILGEVGYEALTIAAVIDRAGVSSATLYRRFAAKHDLVAAAIGSLLAEPADVDTGSLVGDVLAFVRNVSRSISARFEHIAEGLALATRDNPDLDAALREKFLEPRLVQLREILGRARRRGELTSHPSAEHALSLIVGPVYHRAFALREPITPAFVRATATYAVAGLVALGG